MRSGQSSISISKSRQASPQPHSYLLYPLCSPGCTLFEPASLVRLVPSLDSDHPKYIMSDLENHTVITDAESVCMRAGERFSELKRVRLLAVKAHLGGDALFSLGGVGARSVLLP